MTAEKQLGSYFEMMRKRSNLSTEEVCQHLENVKPEVLRAFEAGMKNLSMSDIMAVANIINANPSTVISLIQDDTDLMNLLSTEDSASGHGNEPGTSLSHVLKFKKS